MKCLQSESKCLNCMVRENQRPKKTKSKMQIPLKYNKESNRLGRVMKTNGILLSHFFKKFTYLHVHLGARQDLRKNLCICR